jgi:hypothetical protein
MVLGGFGESDDFNTFLQVVPLDFTLCTNMFKKSDMPRAGVNISLNPIAIPLEASAIIHPSSPVPNEAERCLSKVVISDTRS